MPDGIPIMTLFARQKDGEQLFAYFQNGLSLIKELGQLLRKIAGPDTEGDDDDGEGEATLMEVEDPDDTVEEEASGCRTKITSCYV